MSNTLSVKAVTKIFGRLPAVDNISFEVSPGTIYALIGPNGSGKTTLANCIVGLLRPEMGKVLISGVDIQESPVKAKCLFSYISDNPAVYPYLTGFEFLRLTARLHGLDEIETRKRIDELKGIFPIQDILSTTTDSYSRGNIEKTAFLAAILPKPTLLVIDEPIVGLDPASVKIFGDTLSSFAKHGGTVLLSTHTLSFAKKYADKVGIVQKGKLIKEILITSKIDLEDIYEKTTANI